jgi:hypothetical protein
LIAAPRWLRSASPLVVEKGRLFKPHKVAM